jgi:DNA-binding HxlR family transcriptional regulator
MRASHLSELNCPIARAVGVVGDPWYLMIVRELYLGSRRSISSKAICALQLHSCRSG